MKLCCANVPIVLSEMRIRMEWASDEYCMCIAQALKMWTSGGSYSLWPSLEPWQSKKSWFQSFRWFLFRMVSLYFDSVRICRTGHAACPDLVL